MMNIKKAVVALSLALPVGGVVAVGAAQAYQQAAGERDKIVVDGKTYVAEPKWPKTYPVTYYVGDILGVPKYDPNQPLGDKPFDPIMKLIMNTIKPGTWLIAEGDGREVNGKDGFKVKTRRTGQGPTGTITPFFPSTSLIIRHSAETHEQIADLLRNLRALVNAAVTRATTTSTKHGQGYFEYRENAFDDLQEKVEDYIRFMAKTPADPATIKGGREEVYQVSLTKLQKLKWRAKLKALRSDIEALLEADLLKVNPVEMVPLTPLRSEPAAKQK